MVLITSDRDPLFDAAVEWAKEEGRVSASMLQRRLIAGYARACRIIDQLISAGVVEPYGGSAWLRTLRTEDSQP